MVPRLALKLVEALHLLKEAADYATQLERPRWDFAVEYATLRHAGLSRNDCRWIVCRGWVSHAQEVTSTNSAGREFQPENELSFSKSSCFVLTEKGLVLMASAQFATPDRNMAPCETVILFPPEQSVRQVPPHQPRFLNDLRELRVGEQLVKRFRLPSRNQETILLAFEEEGWPRRIDDPLPPSPFQECSHRLRETIKSLNRHQVTRLIHFSAAGDGQGVLWSLLDLGPGVQKGS